MWQPLKGREYRASGRREVVSDVPVEQRSPLWMVTREPALNRLVGYLDAERRRIEADPDRLHTLEFSRQQLSEVREAFSRMIRQGESCLHRLCELFAGEMLDARYNALSVVVGQDPVTGERFTLSQPVRREDLYAQTDLDLGNHLLDRHRLWSGKEWLRADLVANFVEYEALELNATGVHKIISRIKAEEEIWNKVVDEIFEIDKLVARDKQLRDLSNFVKDIFGLKIVVSDTVRAYELQPRLERLSFTDAVLADKGAPLADSPRRLEFLEVKDYLDGRGKKTSGWLAIKSVVNWWGLPFEIQIQPLHNYHRERERLTQESHSEFKARREAIRNEVAAQLPLFGFYRDLLQWMFLTPEEPPPRFHSVVCRLTD